MFEDKWITADEASIVLALVGGVLGGVIVYAAFDGYSASTLNNTAHAQVAFGFRVTPRCCSSASCGRWRSVSSVVCCRRYAPRACRSLLHCEGSERGE